MHSVQHYCYSLAKQHQKKQRLHNIKVIRNRKSSLVMSKTISILPPQKDRFFVGLLRWLITFPTARQHSKNNPIGAYQLEERYIIRLVLIMVGIVAAAIIWTTVNLSENFLIWKLNFVTNPVRFNGDGNYNSSTSSNITALAVENFRNNITGKLNITAASDAATLFVTTRTTDFDSSGYYGLPMGFGCFLGFNVFFTVLAFLPVMYRPMSGGSGIAEAKATLNGTLVIRNQYNDMICSAKIKNHQYSSFSFFCFIPFPFLASHHYFCYYLLIFGTVYRL